MEIRIFDNPIELGEAAATEAIGILAASIKEKGSATLILATGQSQFATLSALTATKEIDWSRVRIFHLDEYIGIKSDDFASFRRYLKERFFDKVSPLMDVFLIDGQSDPERECLRLDALIRQFPPDVALVGIGENGHLAFNDPPADFETRKPFLIVQLDQACRRQQYNEGWFVSPEAVPLQAISMSVNEICRTPHIIVSVPGERKATAVRDTLSGEIGPMFPASVLRNHPGCILFLDPASAALTPSQLLSSSN